jgi:predicted phosphodiesterase
VALAALYDIHANLPALEAVLADALAAGAREFIVGGDIAPGPEPRAVFERLMMLARTHPVGFIRGNCENAMLAVASGDGGRLREWVPAHAISAIRWSLDRLVAGPLEEEPLHEFERWPGTLRRAIPGIGEVLFCHGTPRHANEIFTRLTDEAKLRPIIDAAGADAVVCGHTHMQFDRRIGTTRVVNAGSVGMPFGEPGAYWMLLGPRIELRRSEFDAVAVAAAIAASGCPGAELFLSPPTEAAMLQNYARAELNRG